MPGATKLDRIIVAAVSLLIAAFALSAMSVLVKPAFADDPVGMRDDDAVELVAKDDDDDDDTGDDNGDETRTGTTQGTGPSNTNTRDTKTGTVTQNTASRSA